MKTLLEDHQLTKKYLKSYFIFKVFCDSYQQVLHKVFSNLLKEETLLMNREEKYIVWTWILNS